MKKVKFAIQVFVLAAMFPALFIAGISKGDSVPEDTDKAPAPAIEKEMANPNSTAENFQQMGDTIIHGMGLKI
ncbi:MAG: hypothetical protein U0T68_03210 [Ferruginibacter sp.]|jgi:hypothetical protein